MGKQRPVDIEDSGDQGDGSARGERGYVSIGPDAAVNELGTVEIKTGNPNVAFGEVGERHAHSEEVR
ncbi:TRAM domain-containing protein [Natrinema sp. SYSU A 869]|uniref:TRAM domain-containing protein n=1 Tax=Natrinema sp. SYSU A 869 TaxID=2871694 RepID=UPI001CA40FD0|nr:TRAM domain-containing protein [Natrinema sp. SYSU A 869]